MLTFYVGSYTEMIAPGFGGHGVGIYCVNMDESTGEIVVVDSKEITNPSYLALSDDSKYLYSISEVSLKKKPKVTAYKINNDKSLEYINEQLIDGAYPCHLTCVNSSLLVSSYGAGKIIQFPVDASGSVLKSSTSFQHKGYGINPERQEGPHVHQACIHPNGIDVLVADLGIDMLKAYQLKNGVLQANETYDISLSNGGGPRHLVFSMQTSFAYVLCELTGVVSVLDCSRNKCNLVNSYYSLPASYRDKPSSSAIRIHPNGQYLYVGNRGLDAITIFRIKDNYLEHVDYQFTNGETIREFNISPDGKWLIACHQDSDDTVVYQILESGKLTEKYRTKDLASPVCVVFMK